MSRPVEGWDQIAQDWWDAASPADKAKQLRYHAEIVQGGTRAYLLAAARTFENEDEVKP